MAKCFSKKYGNKGRASTTCNLKVMLTCLSAPDATSLHHCQRLMLHPYITASTRSSQNLYAFMYLVLCTVGEGVANTCI